MNSNNLFLGGAGDRLYYMIYGIADLVIDNPGGGSTFNIYNIGCTGGVGVAACDGKIHIDIYRTTSTIVNLTLKDPHNRTGFGTYSGVTDLPGSLYLGLTFSPGKVTGSGALRDSATLFQTTNSALLPASGTGTFFADVNAGAAGGSARAKWDSNGIDTGIGTLVDFDGNFTLKPNIRNGAGGIPGGTGACTAAAVAANTCFGGLINDPVQAIALPEPGSLALAGLALAGLAAVGRRARAAKA